MQDTRTAFSVGRRWCQSVACWNMWAARSSRSSSNGGACSCRPIGKSAGTEAAGKRDAADAGQVGADGVQIDQVHRQRIVDLFADLEGRRWS